MKHNYHECIHDHPTYRHNLTHHRNEDLCWVCPQLSVIVITLRRLRFRRRKSTPRKTSPQCPRKAHVSPSQKDDTSRRMFTATILKGLIWVYSKWKIYFLFIQRSNYYFLVWKSRMAFMSLQKLWHLCHRLQIILYLLQKDYILYI